MAPSAVTAVKDFGLSGLKTARRTACRCGRRLLTAAVPAPRGSDDGQKRPSALEGRWSLTALPKASAPPNPLLPSEIKYSASLVRGQAVTHAVLGMLLFITGVLGTRHTGGGGSTSAGVWCGVAAIVCAVCGLMAHRLWYRNWAIKSFLLASTAAAVLCILGLGLTCYFAVLASYSYPSPSSYHHRHPSTGYRYGSYGDPVTEEAVAVVGLNTTSETSSEVKDMFFDLPPPPRTSQSLLGNLIVGLCAELFVSVWSLVVAWRGVQAEEFTISRREELVKEIIARAPASHALSRTTATMDAETNGSMPLAALYHLLQAHPELLTSKLQWGADCPHTPSSHASMDYRERVSRYLSNTLQPEEEPERNPSPSSITSLTKRQRSSSAPDEDHVSQRPAPATTRHMSRSKSEHRGKSKERRRKPKAGQDVDVTKSPGGYSSSSPSPMNSSTSPTESPSDSSPSSTLTRLESSDTSDAPGSKVIVEGGKQSQSLVLGLKTLSPLSSHVINHSEMMPCRKGKLATTQPKTTASLDNEEAVKGSPSVASDSEYNVSFVHTVDKPPPLPKKEYAKPTLVINEKLRQEAEYMNKEQVSVSSKSNSSTNKEESNTNTTQHHRNKRLKELSDRNERTSANLSSKASVVSEKSSTNTLLRRKKDKKPPPIPDVHHSPLKVEVSTTDRKGDRKTEENKESMNRKEVKKKVADIDVDSRIYGNVPDASPSVKSAEANSNEVYVNIPVESSNDTTESRKDYKDRSNMERKQPLSIEIRPYATKSIVIKRDDRGKDGV